MNSKRGYSLTLATALIIVAMTFAVPVTHANDETDDASETTVSWVNLPKAVQDALTVANLAKKFDSLVREEADGVVTFEAEFSGTEIELSEAGDVIESAFAVEVVALPAAIVNEIEKSYPGATLVDAEQVRRTHYELELTTSSGEAEILLYADGSEFDAVAGGERRFGGFDEVLDLDEVPTVIRDALAEWSLVSDFDSIERDEKDGIVSYKARYQGASGITQIKLTEAGDITEIRSIIFPDLLPVAISARVDEHFPGAEITDVTEFRQTYYELIIKTDDDEMEVGFGADGSSVQVD